MEITPIIFSDHNGIESRNQEEAGKSKYVETK